MELFYRGDELYGQVITGHYKKDNGVYITYVWLFRHWMDEYVPGLSISRERTYFEVFTNNNEYYGRIEYNEIEELKRRINRTFKIDMIINIDEKSH